MKKDTFTGNFGFILAAAGSAVGLGNIWKFPYEVGQNGGAIFLVIYLLFTLLFCVPLLMAEIALGRNAKTDVYHAFRNSGGPKWGFVGILGVVTVVAILSFYNVVAGWAFGYFSSFTFGNLIEHDNFEAFFGTYVADIPSNVLYSLGFMALTVVIVSRGIKEGIEKFSRILMPTFFILLVGLIVYSVFLPNAGAGIAFYLKPDWSKFSMHSAYAAMGHAFFSLSIGMGVLITYGSYLKKKQNIVRSALIITVMDILVAFLSGLLIFPLVFSQGLSPSAGPSLVFITLPEIFQSMGPLTGKVLGGIFFLFLCFAALTSTISLLEVPVSFVHKTWNLPRQKVTIGVALVIFLLGVPSMLSQGSSETLTSLSFYHGKSFLEMISEVFSELCLPLGGLLLCVFLLRKWRFENFFSEVTRGVVKNRQLFLHRYLKISLFFIAPVVLGIFIISLLLTKIFVLI